MPASPTSPVHSNNKELGSGTADEGTSEMLSEKLSNVMDPPLTLVPDSVTVCVVFDTGENVISLETVVASPTLVSVRQASVPSEPNVTLPESLPVTPQVRDAVKSSIS